VWPVAVVTCVVVAVVTALAAFRWWLKHAAEVHLDKTSGGLLSDRINALEVRTVLKLNAIEERLTQLQNRQQR
jgi:hypothetical protein